MPRHRKTGRKGRKTGRKGRKTGRRGQRGGSGFGYTAAIPTAAGSFLENRISYDHCTPVQRGGSCGTCGGTILPQVGGGGGAGGYALQFDNSLGKVHSGMAVGACPPAPNPHQIGGGSILSYGYAPGSVVSTSSAHYLDPVRAESSCSR